MDINDLTKHKKNILPVNRILFPKEEHQKKFIFWILFIASLIIVQFWILDSHKYRNDELALDTHFWFRQITATLILIQIVLFFIRYYSIILFNLAVIMNLSFLYLALFTDFFPTTSFVLLMIAPTIFIAVFYERKFSQWFIAINCVSIAGGFLFLGDIHQVWNAILFIFAFLLISLGIYLQNPSIQLMERINQVWEEQYVRMLKLVYDGVMICQDNQVIDADSGFYTLFQITKNEKTIFLKDVLAPEAHQYVYEALNEKETAVLHTLGRRQDGIVFPIVLYMIRQIIDQKPFTIITIHDATKQLGAEYSLQRKNNELLSINRISQTVNSSLSLGEVLSSILEETRGIYKNRLSSIWLLEENTREFVCVNAKGTNATVEIGLRRDLNSGLFQRIIQEQKPIFIEDITQHPIRHQIDAADHGFVLRSILVLPILFQGKVIGVMQFLDDRENLMRKDEIDVLQSIAANSAVAISNARQFERLAGDQQRWRTIQLISQRINACLQPKEIFRAITDNVNNIMSFDYFIIGMNDEQKADYEIVHLIEHNKERQGNQIKVGSGLLEYIIEHGKSVLIDNHSNSEHGKIDLDDLDLDERQIKSILAVPIIRAGKTIGMLSAQSQEAGEYESADIQMLELIAAHTVVALDNASHYQEALESARLRDTIYLIGQEINSRLNPEQVYETIFRAVDKVIPLDMMFISYVDYEQKNHHIQYFRDKTESSERESFSMPIDAGLSARVIKTGKKFRCSDAVMRNELLEQQNYEDVYGDSMIFVPMIRNHLVTGILSVQAKAANQFTTYHETILELIAPYAASALENAWLFSKIEALAITDELSGVYNRHYFNRTLKVEFERSQRYQRSLSLIIIDIDNFKQINDVYGHICGDEVIRQYGVLLKANVRESDIIARFGGDEFSVIMPETDGEKALSVAKKLEKMCSEYQFQIDKHKIQITVSIGLVEMNVHVDTKPEELIQKADYAMYQAKKRGRDQIFTYKS